MKAWGTHCNYSTLLPTDKRLNNSVLIFKAFIDLDLVQWENTLNSWGRGDGQKTSALLAQQICPSQEENQFAQRFTWMKEAGKTFN